jgi:hypothetical protein
LQGWTVPALGKRMASLLFIHGLSNKPEEKYLLELYKRKLAHDGGFDLADNGVAASLIYWANVLYPAPDTDLAAYESAATGDELLEEAREAVTLAPDKLPADEAAFVVRLATTLEVGAEDVDPATLPPDARADLRYERIPLPAFLKNRMMARLVRDAHLYFFNKEFTPRTNETYKVRDELRQRFIEALKAIKEDGRPTVVLAHSMGTMVAYDCLMHEPECPAIDGLMTVGSPLGLDEVQDFWAKWTRDDGFPFEKLKGPWVNVFDRRDLVAGADPWLANDYKLAGKAVIDDVEEPNWGNWRHSISKYLQGKQLRTKLASMLKVDWP